MKKNLTNQINGKLELKNWETQMKKMGTLAKKKKNQKKKR